MAMFELPTFATKLTEIKDVIRGKRPGAATGPGSDADILSHTLAHITHGAYLMLMYGVLHNAIATKSSGWVLSAWAWLFGLSDGSGGFGRIKARGSYADDAFSFVAAAGPGWVDLDGAQFTDTAGNIYEIDESYTPSGAGTTTALRVIAVQWDGDNGAATNLEVNDAESFTWVSTPTQMTSTITQVVDLDHGADREDDGPLRARLATKLQTPAKGGNWAHWREVAEEADPGNVDAYVWEGIHDEANGYGCTDVACLQRAEYNYNREIQDGDDLYTTIEDALDDKLPIGGLFRHRLLDTVQDSQPFECVITLSPNATEAQKCDWDAHAGGFNVSAYHATNQTVTASGDVTSYISVGDRVIIQCAQAVVTKVGIADGLAADTMIEVDSWFTVYDATKNPYPWAATFVPGAANHIISGGGLILACCGAMLELYRGLGPYRGDNAAPIPGWDDTLRLQSCQAALIGVGDSAGNAVIIDVDVSNPAADHQATAGSGTDTYYLGLTDCAIWEDKT